MDIGWDRRAAAFVDNKNEEGIQGVKEEGAYCQDGQICVVYPGLLTVETETSYQRFTCRPYLLYSLSPFIDPKNHGMLTAENI